MNDPHRLPETWVTACGENKQNFQGFNRIQTCASHADTCWGLTKPHMQNRAHSRGFCIPVEEIWSFPVLFLTIKNLGWYLLVGSS